MIDEGLENAIWIKNCEIRDVKTGIVAVDRAPLDFIAFPANITETLGAAVRRRANAVLERLGVNDLRNLCPGQVIVLRADTEMLITRQLQRSGRSKPEEVADGSAKRYLEQQRERLAKIYKKAINLGSVVETDRCSVALSVKAAARIIHFGDYLPFDFAGRLHAIRKGK
jgi:hypothetical protein